MACHGLLSRFPELRITVVENGATWVGPLLDKLHEAYKKMHPEGKGDPITHVDELSKFSEEDRAKIMGGNLARLVDA